MEVRGLAFLALLWFVGASVARVCSLWQRHTLILSLWHLRRHAHTRTCIPLGCFSLAGLF